MQIVQQIKTKSRTTYYSGSNRDVDEYNRRGNSWTHYQQMGVDGKGRKVMSLRKGYGTYPDSMYLDTVFVERNRRAYDNDEDYRMTRRIRRFNGYYDPWYDDLLMLMDLIGVAVGLGMIHGIALGMVDIMDIWA